MQLKVPINSTHLVIFNLNDCTSRLLSNKLFAKPRYQTEFFLPATLKKKFKKKLNIFLFFRLLKMECVFFSLHHFFKLDIN